jgi:hypothetical protein
VDTSFWTHVLPAELLMSLGLGLAFPALSSTALVKVADRDSGVASALVNTTKQVGGSLGTSLLNTVAASATASFISPHGPGAEAAGTVHGFAVAFAVGAGFLTLAAIVSAVFVSARGDEVPAPAGATSAAPATAEAFRQELDDAPGLDGPSAAALLDDLVAAEPMDEVSDPAGGAGMRLTAAGENLRGRTGPSIAASRGELVAPFDPKDIETTSGP